MRILIFLVAVVVMVGLWYLLNRTMTGKALKAVSEDATTSNLLGISTDRLIMFTFGLCGFVAAIAGSMFSANFGVSGPYMGSQLGLIGLSVIILGGLGDVPGAVLGGFVALIMCSSNLPDKVAIALDVQMDDGLLSAGFVRGIDTAGNPAITATSAPTTASFVETGTTFYTLCRQF